MNKARIKYLMGQHPQLNREQAAYMAKIEGKKLSYDPRLAPYIHHNFSELGGCGEVIMQSISELCHDRAW